MKIAVVGATGLVGSKMLEVLDQRNFPFSELLPVASERSAGALITFKGKEYTVITLDQALKEKPAIALFSAGGEVSKEWAPRFAAVGTTVIDNSSAWRMDAQIPLIVPEINADSLNKSHKIIANPNCSTIQMVVALHLIHRNFGLKRLVISTYQSVTGTGVKAVTQLFTERKGETVTDPAYPYPIDLNVIPQIDVFLENAYTKEEMKMIAETKKILADQSIGITATAIRIPVVGGHSESINVETREPFTLQQLLSLFQNTPGVVLKDDIHNKQYPMPIDAHDNDSVWVGRVRIDESQANTFNLWVVSDNLRKGAATNAVQIAEYLLNNNLLSN
jgi:aspartate-semialdehyde dehydrogenase